MSKFKNTEELKKAYEELEREFTKKSQKLAEVENPNYVTLLHNEMDNLLNDYAKKRIYDLEAKLAESEKSTQAYEEIVEQKNEELNFANRDKTCIVKQLNDPKAYVLLEDYKRIEQQLAEKDEQLNSAQVGEEFALKCCDEANKLLALQVAGQHKDKISFAVEQLEKVKELLLESLYDLYSKPSEIWDKYGDLYDVVVEGAVNGTIDNQIKAIKGEK